MRSRVFALLLLSGCSTLLGVEDLAGPPDASSLRLCHDEKFDPPLDIGWSTFTGVNATAVAESKLIVTLANNSTMDYAGATLKERDLTGVTMEVDILAYPQKFGSDAHAQWRTMTNQFYTLHFEPTEVSLEAEPGQSMGPFAIMPGDVTFRLEHRADLHEMHAAVLRGGEWNQLGAISADIPTDVLNVVLTAGTFSSVTDPGQVEFDNLHLLCP